MVQGRVTIPHKTPAHAPPSLLEGEKTVAGAAPLSPTRMTGT